MRRVISIDPGLDGAIAVLEGGVPSSIYDMPTKTEKTRREICPERLAEIITSHLDGNTTVVVIEKVGGSPRMAPGAAFNFGEGFGMARGVCAALLVPHFLLTPQKWKAVHGLTGKDKDASRQLALSKYPEHAEWFKRKKDTDRAEAILIGLAWERLNKIGKA